MPTGDLSRFSPDAFFALAAERLAAPSPPTAGGDHVLNPGMFGERASYRDAAVLVPVLARNPVSVLLTLRTPHLSSHAGQIAFPGGRIDDADAGPVAAALREAREEIGLEASAVDVVGELDPYLTGTGYHVVPVLARVAPDAPLRINPGEVAEIFEVPLSFLMTAANHRQGSRVLAGRERFFYEIVFERRIIWGATAGILRRMYERIFG